jgi:hypothetical protein
MENDFIQARTDAAPVVQISDYKVLYQVRAMMSKLILLQFRYRWQNILTIVIPVILILFSAAMQPILDSILKQLFTQDINSITFSLNSGLTSSGPVAYQETYYTTNGNIGLSNVLGQRDSQNKSGLLGTIETSTYTLTTPNVKTPICKQFDKPSDMQSTILSKLATLKRPSPFGLIIDNSLTLPDSGKQDYQVINILQRYCSKTLQRHRLTTLYKLTTTSTFRSSILHLTQMLLSLSLVRAHLVHSIQCLYAV